MYKIEIEREDDGRWIAEIAAFPGALAYGATEPAARANVEALVRRVVADRIKNGEVISRDV
jgi:predicted RNase H-like HicB family nuclease